MKKFLQSQKVKVKTVSLLSNPKLEKFLLKLFIFLLPTQLGFHFWPEWTKIFGIRVDYLSPTLFLTDILAVLLIGIGISKFKTSTIKKYFFPLVTLVLFASLNTYLAVVWQIALIKWLKVVELTFISVYFYKRATLKDITNPLLYSLLFFSTIGIWQLLNQSTLGGVFYYLGERTFNSSTPGISMAVYLGNFLMRPYSTFSHPNSLAGFLIVGSVLIYKKTPKKALLIIPALTIVLTASKTAVAVLLLLPLLYFLTNKRRMQVLLTSLAVSLASLFIFRNMSLQQNLFSESIFKRADLIKSAGEMIAHSPLFGTGLNNFVIRLVEVGSTPSVSWWLQPVHNIFLLTLTELGVAGLLIFVYVLMGALKNTQLTRNPTLAITLLAITITGLTDHYWLTLQQNQLLFSVVLGLSYKLKEVIH